MFATRRASKDRGNGFVDTHVNTDGFNRSIRPSEQRGPRETSQIVGSALLLPSAGLIISGLVSSPKKLGRQSLIDDGILKRLKIRRRVAAKAAALGPDGLAALQAFAEVAPGREIPGDQVCNPDRP
jgi:hypothetical protein